MNLLQTRIQKTGLTILFGLICIFALYRSALAQNEDKRYTLQAGTPVGIQNFVEMESGCSWSGIGGQVFALDGQPITGLVIKIAGEIDGNEILVYGITGGSLKFGPGGFLMTLSDHPVESNGALSLQVLDIAGNELSPNIALNSYGDCPRNLLLVNIQEYQIHNPIFLPIVWN
jgi:hypothetical protein